MLPLILLLPMNEEALKASLDETELRHWRALLESSLAGEWITITMENKGVPYKRVDWRIQYDAEHAAQGVADDLVGAVADMYFDAGLQGFLNTVPDSVLAAEFPDQEIFRERILDAAAATPVDNALQTQTEELEQADRYISAIESTCRRCGYIQRVEMPDQDASLQLLAVILNLSKDCPCCYAEDTDDYEPDDSTLAQQELEDVAHDNEIDLSESFDEEAEVE